MSYRGSAHTHSTHTRSGPSEKRMAQQSPGHNASLHPLISAERIERRRKKRGGNKEVGGQRELYKKKQESREREQGKKKLKERKVERMGGG